MTFREKYRLPGVQNRRIAMSFLTGVTAKNLLLPFDENKPLFDYKKTESYIAPENVPEIVKTADELLDKDIPLLTASLYREFEQNGNRTHYENPYFLRKKMMFAFAFAEYATHSGKYMSKLIDLVWDTLNMPTWGLPAHTSGNTAARPAGMNILQLPCDYKEEASFLDLFAASMGAELAVIHFLLKDEFEKEVPFVINDRILYEINRRLFDPYLKYTDYYWWAGKRTKYVNNWCPWIISNILCAASLTCTDAEKREKITDTALASLSVYLDTIKPEGGCDEGPGYWFAAGLSTFMALLVIYDMTGGKLNFFNEPQLKNMSEYLMKMNISGDRFANFADCRSYLYKNYTPVYAFGKYTGNQAVCRWASSMNSVCTLDDAEHGYRSLIELCTVLQKPEKPFQPQGVTVQSDLGLAFLRKGPYYAAFKGGHNAESHNHNDVGTNIVFKDQSPVLIDIGNDQYTKLTFSDKRYTLPSNRSIYHNTLSTDDTEQLPGVQYHAENFAIDTAALSASMTLEKAYAPESGILAYKKTTSVTDAGVTILNDITLDHERLLKINLILCAAPEPVSDRSFAVTSNGVRAVVTYPEGFDYAVEILPLAEHPFWKHSYPDSDAIYRVILSKKTAGGSFAVTVE